MLLPDPALKTTPYTPPVTGTPSFWKTNANGDPAWNKTSHHPSRTSSSFPGGAGVEAEPVTGIFQIRTHNYSTICSAVQYSHGKTLADPTRAGGHFPFALLSQPIAYPGVSDTSQRSPADGLVLTDSPEILFSCLHSEIHE